MNKIFLVGGVSIIFLSACGNDEGFSASKSLDVMDYVVASDSGFNGYGHLNYYYQSDELMADLGLDSFEDREEIKVIKDAIELRPESSTRNLSNGDEITMTARVHTDELPEGINIQPGKEKTYVIDELDELEVLTTEDIHENVEIEFTGYDGKGYVNRINNHFEEPFTALQDIDFYVDNKEHNLKNGDIVNIVVNDNLTTVLGANGYILEDNFDPGYVVSGLSKGANY